MPLETPAIRAGRVLRRHGMHLAIVPAALFLPAARIVPAVPTAGRRVSTRFMRLRIAECLIE